MEGEEGEVSRRFLIYSCGEDDRLFVRDDSIKRPSGGGSSYIPCSSSMYQIRG